jgi:putative ABC transport system permease protein
MLLAAARSQQPPKEIKEMNYFTNELQQSLRSWRRQPGFILAAIITLGLGIGANTAIFSVINGLLLRPLPFPRSESLMLIWENNPTINAPVKQLPVSIATFRDWERMNRSFQAISGFWVKTVDLVDSGYPERLEGIKVCGDLFQTLGVSPLLGRKFTSADEIPGSDNVMLVSYELWRNRFGADASIVGRKVQVDGQTWEIIGVLPPQVKFPRRIDMPVGYTFFPETVDFWTPYAPTTAQLAKRGSRNLVLVGRLKNTITLSAAQQDLSRIEAELAKIYPAVYRNSTVSLISLKQQGTKQFRGPLFILFGVVAFILLIACVNVSNLLLARLAQREKEAALRMALGSSVARLVTWLLAESLLISIGGALLGSIMGFLGLHAAMPYFEQLVGIGHDFSFDWHVFLFTIALALVTALITPLASAFHILRANARDVLSEYSAHSSLGRRGIHTIQALVIGEVAAALVLTAGAGVMLKTFMAISKVNTGLNPTNVMTAEVTLPSAYSSPGKQAHFFQLAVHKLNDIFGPHSSGAISTLPLSGVTENTPIITEEQERNAFTQTPLASYYRVSPDFFRAIGTPIIAGRPFLDDDGPTHPPVAIINQACARQFWPGENPLGKQLRRKDANASWITVIGIVGDWQYVGKASSIHPAVFRPLSQDPDSSMTLVVRSSQAASTVARVIRRIIQGINRSQPVAKVRTMEDVLHQDVEAERFVLFLLGAFAVIGYTMAGIGVFAIVAFVTNQRSQELAIRVAVGANAAHVIGLIVRQSLIMVGLGIVVGLPLAVGLGRLLGAILYKVAPMDISSLAIACALFIIPALLACYLPVRRVLRVGLVRLRYE